MAELDPDLEDLVDYCMIEKQSGTDYSLLRDKLRAKGLDQETIQIVLQECDDRLLEQLQTNSTSFNLLDRLKPLAGRFMIYLGIVVTVVSYLMADENGGVYVIWYGPVLSGIGIVTTRKARKFLSRDSFFASPFQRWRDR